MIVRVAEFGGRGRTQEVNLSAGATVADALRAAGLSESSAKEVRVNQDKGTLTTPLRDNDVVVLVPRVEGAA